VEVALKISRNKKFDVENAAVEVKVLQALNNNDPLNKQGIVRLLENFQFRKHYVSSHSLSPSSIGPRLRSAWSQPVSLHAVRWFHWDEGSLLKTDSFIHPDFPLLHKKDRDHPL
jgi:hypothetical protein